MSVTTPILRFDPAAADAASDGEAASDGAAEAASDGAADGAVVAAPELQAATKMDSPATRVSPRERVRMFPPPNARFSVHDGLLPRDRVERRAAASCAA